MPVALYILLFAAAAAACLMIPARFRAPGARGRVDDAERLAFLTGGRARYADAVAAGLLARGALAMLGSGRFGAAAHACGRTPGEVAVLALAGEPCWSEVVRALRGPAERVEDGLIASGLLIDRAAANALRWRQAAPLLALTLLGLIAGVPGVPIAATVGAASVRWIVVDRRTRAGFVALGEARARSARLGRAPMADEVDMAVALFGTGVLVGSAWGGFHDLRAARGGEVAAGSGDGDGDGGCGDGCGGGCGS